MSTGTAERRRRTRVERRRQVNVRVEAALYRTLESLARQERRSIPQTARRLMEDGLRQLVADPTQGDVSGEQLARLAIAGGSFDWLAGEPDLYDHHSGEPI